MYRIQQETGCWIWEGPTCSQGRYGRIPGTSRLRMAHVDAFERHNGTIPIGLHVCHTCDNGLCVNPDHLFLGSHSDNMKDAARKGRLPHLLNQAGEANSNAKYTREFADAVRSYYEQNKPTFSELASHFELKSKGHAHAIVKRRIWP